VAATPDPSDGPRPAGSPDDGDGGGSRWIVVLIGIGFVALLILMVVLHLSGTLGPGMH
jgi:hypothetical protein